MLSAFYTLPKTLLAILIIGLGILFILLGDPPHQFCDSQVEHFKRLQKGLLYKNPKDFHKEKSILKRKKNLCQMENAPGACYEYFAYLKRLLKDFRVLSQKCQPMIYATREVKKALSSALTLIVALAWREELLTGVVSKYNWLTRPDMYLFCEIKSKYIMQYGRKDYDRLENQILKLLPFKKGHSLQVVRRYSILSESCLKYR